MIRDKKKTLSYDYMQTLRAIKFTHLDAEFSASVFYY